MQRIRWALSHLGVVSGLVLIAGSLLLASMNVQRSGQLVGTPKTGDHPAQPATFDQPGHQHHPPNSVVGRDTPDLIPDALATGLLLRAVSDAKRRDGTSGTNTLERYVKHIEKSTGHTFNPLDRQSIFEFAANDLRGRRASDADGLWRQLLTRVNPEARRALVQFRDVNVKRNTKLLR